MLIFHKKTSSQELLARGKILRNFCQNFVKENLSFPTYRQQQWSHSVVRSGTPSTWLYCKVSTPRFSLEWNYPQWSWTSRTPLLDRNWPNSGRCRAECIPTKMTNCTACFSPRSKTKFDCIPKYFASTKNSHFSPPPPWLGLAHWIISPEKCFIITIFIPGYVSWKN